MKLFYRFWCIAAVLLAAVACEAIQEENNLPIDGFDKNAKGVFCHFTPIVPEDPATKGVDFSADPKVTFDEEDQITIWSASKTALFYTLTNINGSYASAYFDGGGFKLTSGDTYTSLYPAMPTLKFDAVPMTYTGQVQSAKNNSAHLKDYLYYWAAATCDNGHTEFDYHTISGFIQFELTFPEAVTINTVKLVAESNVFATAPTFNAGTGEIAKGDLTNEISITLKNGFSVAENETIIVYMAAAPFESATVSVKAIDSANSKVYTSTSATVSALESGKTKGLRRAMKLVDGLIIDASTESSVDLKTKGAANEINTDVGDLYVTIAQSTASAVDAMTIATSGTGPENLYLTIVDNYGGAYNSPCDLSDLELTINLPNTHVVISAEAAETIGSIETNTSLNTLVLADKITVGDVTIAQEGGGLTVNGTITGTLSVPDQAAKTKEEPEKVWVKINETATVNTISVGEVNCNLYIAGTVTTVTTSATQTTVDGTVTGSLTANTITTNPGTEQESTTTAEVIITSNGSVAGATVTANGQSEVYIVEGADIEEATLKDNTTTSGVNTGSIVPAAEPEAAVNGVEYMTLAKAMAAVPTNGLKTTVTLLKDKELDAPLDIETGMNVVLDLTTHTIQPEVGFEVPGSMYNETLFTSGIVRVKRGAELTVKGTTGKISSYDSENTGRTFAAVAITAPGESATGDAATLTVEGGNLEGYYYGIVGNGNRHNTSVTVSGGNVSALADGTAIYQPQEGTLTISGGTITGSATGVEIRSGSLTMTKGTVTGNGTPASVTPNGNGTTTVGAGIAVAQHNTHKDITVNVSGGTVNGYTGLYLINPQNNTAQYMEQVNVSITGGTFNAINEGTNSVAKGNNTDSATLSITGGTFNSDPTEYLAAGYFAADNDNGTWTVDGPYVARIGAIGYTTLQAAVDAAQSGATITILSDFTTAESSQFSGITNPNSFGVVIEKSLTIEGKGHAITGTADKRPFGIAGNGINVVLKDLTIKNNGSNGPTIWTCGPMTLTLDNSTVDGTNTKGTYNQPVTIGSDASLTGRYTLNVINNSVIKTNNEAKAHYDIIVLSPADINISNSTLKGYAAVYVKPDASGTVTTVSNSDIESHGYSGLSNAFGMFVAESDNNIFTLTSNNYRITAGDQYQVLTEVDGTVGNVVKLLGTSTFTPNDPVHGTVTSNWCEYYVNSLYMDDANKTLFDSYIPEACTVAQVAEGKYAGLWKVTGPIPEIHYYYDTDYGQLGSYCKLEYPFDNEYLYDGEYIDLMSNITLTKTIACKVTSGSFRFRLGEYSVTKGEYSITLKTGVSVVTDKPTDIFTAAAEGAAIAVTAGTGTYTYTAVAAAAQIGQNSYATLTEAIAAANESSSPSTITLLQDVALNTGNVRIEKEITLNLNGKTITNNAPTSRLFRVYNGVDFTIDGTVNGSSMVIPESNKSSYGFVNIDATSTGSTLTVNGGNYSGAMLNGVFFKTLGTSQTVTLNNVNCVVENGDGLKYGNMNSTDINGIGGVFEAAGSTASLNVNGGTFTSYSTREKGDKPMGIFNATRAIVSFNNATIISVSATGIEMSKGVISGSSISYPSGQQVHTWANTAIGLSSGSSVPVLIDSGEYRGEYGINVYTSGTNATIDGGTFEGHTAALHVHDNSGYPTRPFAITINGGNFIGSGSGENSVAIETMPNDPTQIVINGGSFTGKLLPGAPAHLSITGGTFDHDPSAYVAAGYEATYDSTTQKWTVAQMQVAKIGNTPYATLAAALAAATSGQTVTLLSNVETTAQLEVDKEMTLDLNGKTIQYTGTSTLASGVIMVLRGANLTITDSDSNGSILGGEMAYAAVALTKNGETSTADAQLTVNGGTLRGHYYAIVGNGNRQGTVITVNGGTLVGAEGSAIFHPQAGTLTITGGSLSGAETGVELRSGTLNISGGTFTATATEYSCTPTGDGTTTIGAALAIAQHTTNQAITANITGGTFVGTKKLSIANPQNNAFNNVTVSGLNTLFGDSVVVPDGYIWSNNGDGTSSLFKPVTTWDGSSKEALTVVDADTYAIYSAAQLAQFAYNVNNGTNYAGKTVVLMNDIDLNNLAWTPISLGGSSAADDLGSETGCFLGTFDGNHKTISNLKVTHNNDDRSFAGLFGTITVTTAKTVTIKDVTVSGVDVNSEHMAAGILARYDGVSASAQLVIDGCSVVGTPSKNTITSTPFTNSQNKKESGNQAAGIVGCAFGKGGYTIQNCSVSGVTIQGTRDLGAIAGAFLPSGSSTFANNSASNCTITQVYPNDLESGKDMTAVHELVGRTPANWEVPAGNTATNVTVNLQVPGVARIGDTYYTTLADAVAAAADGATIKVIKAGEYSIPAITKTLTFDAIVDGVVVNHTTNSAITTIASGKKATFKNMAFNLAEVSKDEAVLYGFGTGELEMDGCTISNSLSLFGESTFNNCSFTASGKYNIWAVCADATFSNCTFTNTNRAVNVYDSKHGNTAKDVVFTECTFKATGEPKKAAINIHHNPDGTPAKYNVFILTSCKTEGTWANSTAITGEAETTECNESGLWMISDITGSYEDDIDVYYGDGPIGGGANPVVGPGPNPSFPF